MGSQNSGVYLFDRVGYVWKDSTGGYIYSVDISADGEYITAGGTDENIYLYSKDSSDYLWKHRADGAILTVSISANGEYIAAGGLDDNKLYAFHKNSSVPLWVYDAGEGVEFQSVSLSEDGSYLAVGYDNSSFPLASLVRK